jgi:hypothetical protein
VDTFDVSTVPWLEQLSLSPSYTMMLASAIFGESCGCPDNFDSGAATAMVDFRIMCSVSVFRERRLDDPFDPNP